MRTATESRGMRSSRASARERVAVGLEHHVGATLDAGRARPDREHGVLAPVLAVRPAPPGSSCAKMARASLTFATVTAYWPPCASSVSRPKNTELRAGPRGVPAGRHPGMAAHALFETGIFQPVGARRGRGLGASAERQRDQQTQDQGHSARHAGHGVPFNGDGQRPDDGWAEDYPRLRGARSSGADGAARRSTPERRHSGGASERRPLVSEWFFTSDLHGQQSLYDQLLALAVARPAARRDHRRRSLAARHRRGRRATPAALSAGLPGRVRAPAARELARHRAAAA